MKFSSREMLLTLATGTVVLFGVSFMLAGPKIAAWKQLRTEQARVAEDLRKAKSLVAKREFWQKQFDELSGQLPQLPAGRKVDVHWLSTMDRVAAKNTVSILRRDAGEEKKAGDVYELAVECRDWEASLDNLVRFLYDLQSEGSMFDVRQLFVKPKDQGTLRGRFTLYCAYTREPVEEQSK